MSTQQSTQIDTVTKKIKFADIFMINIHLINYLIAVISATKPNIYVDKIENNVKNIMINKTNPAKKISDLEEQINICRNIIKEPGSIQYNYLSNEIKIHLVIYRINFLGAKFMILENIQDISKEMYTIKLLMNEIDESERALRVIVNKYPFELVYNDIENRMDLVEPLIDRCFKKYI